MKTTKNPVPSLYAADHLPNTGGWKDRHNQAIRAVLNPKNDPANARALFERSIVRGLYEWENYADAHEIIYESKIGDDHVLGPHWRDWGLALRGLLNGDVGPRLDCGTLDGFILDTLAVNGVDTEGL